MVRLTDRPDMTLDVYRGRKTKIQQQLEVPHVCRAGLDVCMHLLWNLAVTQTAQSCPLIEYIIYVFELV